MNQLALDANRRLAAALGWTNIVDVGNALLGKPAWVCDNSRSQVQVPNWAGDWKDCGPLIEQYRIALNPALTQKGRYLAETEKAALGEFGDSPMLAIVAAVCAQLEAGA